MLFRRKRKLSRLQELEAYFKPKKSRRRVWSYLWHRLGRLKGGSYNIAAGLACGVAVSFTPLIGAHILLALLFCWLLRGNLFAALVGTLVGNPVTFPFIWGLDYYAGSLLMNSSGGETQAVSLSPPAVQDYTLVQLFLSDYSDNLFLLMLIGSLPLVLIAWVVSFTVSYFVVSKYKLAKAKIRQARKNKKNEIEN